jgi:DNA primase
VSVVVERVWPTDDPGLLAAVTVFYRDALAGSLEAAGWLEGYRIADARGVERFGLGVSDRTLGLAVGPRERDRDGVRDRLQRLGVLRDSGHEHFRGCVTFPIVDAAGVVVQVFGRTVGDDARWAAGSRRWLPGLRRGVWNLTGIESEVIVTDGLVDALSCWSYGFESVTAADGPGGFDDELTTALVERGVKRVVVAFENTAAGDIGAKEVAARLGPHGVSVARAVLPPERSVHDALLGAKHPRDLLGRLLRQAVWIDSTPAPKRTTSPPSPPSASLPSLPSPELSLPVESLPLPVELPAVEALPVELAAPSGAVVDGELRLVFADRSWRVRGLAKLSSFEVLRVNVLVARGERFHVDGFDLYQAKARALFAAAAAVEIGADEQAIKADLGKVLLSCEVEAERVVRDAQTPKRAVVEISPADREAALDMLRDPCLVERIAGDLGRVGIVGETSNGVVAYLAAVSRLLDQPLAVVVQSTSAAGKSALVDAVLGFVPPEDLVRYSAMTGQSLFYMGGGDLAHKVLAVAEEEGAARAAYALKLLQSDGELSIASTGKETTSGRLVTHTYRVQGPTAIFLTTTAIDVDEELLNRCLVIGVDESTTQTRAIHARQRVKETLAGLMVAKERDAVVSLHRNAQRLLEPVAVVNPFAERLTFTDSSTRTRRDHAKYLGLIRAVTFLHQHQRARHTVTVDGADVVYIEATVADIQIANRVAHEVLGRSLDELPPQTRRLLDLAHGFVTALTGSVRFSRRQLREAIGWGDTQLKVHLARLVDLELITAHRGDGNGLAYELVWSGQGVDGSRFVIGLTDPATLETVEYDGGRSGQNSGRSGPGRPSVGARSGGGRSHPKEVFPLVDDGIQPVLFENQGNNKDSDPRDGVVVVLSDERAAG